MISGKPIFSATCAASRRSVTGSSVPGTTERRPSRPARGRRVLSPSSSSRSALGPTNVMPAALAGARQSGVFGQEAIAGMDRVDAFFLRQRDDAVDVQVGLDRALALADQVGFVRLEAVQAEAVFLGIDGDGAQAELGGGAHDADGDFAAVEGEQLLHLAGNPRRFPPDISVKRSMEQTPGRLRTLGRRGVYSRPRTPLGVCAYESENAPARLWRPAAHGRM